MREMAKDCCRVVTVALAVLHLYSAALVVRGHLLRAEPAAGPQHVLVLGHPPRDGRRPVVLRGMYPALPTTELNYTYVRSLAGLVCF